MAARNALHFARSRLADFLEWWPIRYLGGPALLVVVQWQDALWWRALLIILGLLAVEGSSIVSSRRWSRTRQEVAKKEAQLALTQQLIDIVTGIEADLPNPGGRFRAVVYLPDQDDQGREALRTAYYTPGFTRQELALTWLRGQGAVGEAWRTDKVVVAPDPKRPRMLDDWRLENHHKAAVGEVAMVVAAPLHCPDSPSECVGVFVIDDNLAPGAKADAVEATVRRFCDRVTERLMAAGLAFPSYSRSTMKPLRPEAST